jgi:hypothetical protein
VVPSSIREETSGMTALIAFLGRVVN